MGLKKYNLRFSATNNWDEGLPIGNGGMGSLVYGTNPLKVSVDRIDLWDLRPNETTKEKGFTFKNLVKLSTSGRKEDWVERNRLFEDIFMGKPYPSKITAGHIELDFGDKGKQCSYSIDWHNAVVFMFFDGQLAAEIFMPSSINVGVIKLYRDCTIALHVPTYLSGKPQNKSGLDESISETLGYPQARQCTDGAFTWYEQNTNTNYSFGIVAYKMGGEIYYTLATTDDCTEYIEYAKELLKSAAAKGIDQLLTQHKKDWKKYWSKSSIKTGDALIDETYQKSWYLFKCCSKKGGYPMPLQGVWTADNDCLPPWKGDYHFDTNVELSYQSYLKANRIDEGKALVEYLWNMRHTYKKFARDFFDVEGILLPSCSTLDGRAMGGWAQYSLSPTMTIWAAQSFDEYYFYTGDKAFLKNRAYPFMREVGRAIEGLLQEKNGKLYLPVSTSPEIYDATPKAYLEPNSNFDLSLMIYLYKTLRGYAKEMGEDAQHYEKLLKKLDDIAIDESGVVMLDRRQKLPETHRHFSHIMCLYPLHLINYDTNEHKRIYESTIAQLELLGTGLWVGFSFAMMSQIYAMAKKGNASYEKLYQFCRGFVGENGFHLNGDFKQYGYTTFHYRPFTLESLFGFCDALQEMLLQDHQRYIELFPAIPDEWKKSEISFKNLRSRGGLLISAKMTNGKVHDLIINAPKSCTVKIDNHTLVLKKGTNKF